MLVKTQYSGVPRDPEVPILGTGGQWVEQIIPLSDLGATETRLSGVRSPFIFEVPDDYDATYTYSIDHIRWTKPVVDLFITPAATQMSAGESRQFTVEGRDANGESVTIYPQFSSTAGTLSTPAKARSVALTWNGPAANGLITAMSDGVTKDASVSFTPNAVNKKLGLLSESCCGVSLDADSQLILFSENSSNQNTLPIFADVSGQSPEVVVHHRLSFNRKTSESQFQGMAIKWGNFEQPNAVRNMSEYFDGSLRFWFKGPAQSSQLMNKLTVGIRSGNVPAGQELSKVLLKDFVAFDDQWHEVAIPFSELAGAAPWADLSRVQLLAYFSIPGLLPAEDEALRTIYIDNLRWDAKLPPPLVPGDYNHDGAVNAADYTVWRDTLGSTTELLADGNHDGRIDQADYDVWRMNFGTSGGVAQTAVPESSTLTVLASGIVAALLARAAATNARPLVSSRQNVCATQSGLVAS